MQYFNLVLKYQDLIIATFIKQSKRILLDIIYYQMLPPKNPEPKTRLHNYKKYIYFQRIININFETMQILTK